MQLAVSNFQPIVAISQQGEPTQPLTFALTLNQEEVDGNSGYALEIRLSRNGGQGPLWDETKSFAIRSQWGNYAITVSVDSLQANTPETIHVNERWWRDIARTLRPGESIAVTCQLEFEGTPWTEPYQGPPLPPPQNLTLRSALQSLTLTSQNPCYNNGDATGLHGFSHYEQILITARGDAKYAIVQWLQGIFVQWREPDSSSTQQTLEYRYLQIPSCGVNVAGYSPVYIPDGSLSGRAWPNFFSPDAGSGVDKPGDPPTQEKIWGAYDRELMLIQFQVQVYLACDIDAGTDYRTVLPAPTDVNGKKYQTHTDFRFSSSEFLQELSEADLPLLESGAWFSGILQKKGNGINTAAPVASPAALAPDDVPEAIHQLIDAAFQTDTPLPRVIMRRA